MTAFILRRSPDGFSFCFTMLGETLLQSKRYANRNTCRNGVYSVRKNALKASVERGFHPQYRIIERSPGNLCFTLSASNGQVVAQSKYFPDRNSCIRAIEQLKHCVSDAVILNEDGSEP